MKANSAAKIGASDASESRALSDNYVIIGPLAETDFSVVEIIREIETGRYLLAKKLKNSTPQAQERFHQAILEQGRLQHKNIVQTVDWRLSDAGEPVFITEFLEGVNLDQLIDEVGTLEDDEEITTFLIQVCDALEYAHSEYMIHGGLTPSNIVITQPDESILVKIADFGATNSSRELPKNPNRMRPPYMAPEQLNGGLSEKTDVFSVAAVAYQLITGFLPYGTAGDGTEFAPIGDYRPDIPETEKLSFVLERALQLDPDERTSSISDFKRGVREWYQSIGDADDSDYDSGEFEEEEEEEEEEREEQEEESRDQAHAQPELAEETFAGSQQQSFQEAQRALAELDAQADDGQFQTPDEPVSEIGIVVKPLERKASEDEDELDYIDELDEDFESASSDDQTESADEEFVIAQPEPASIAQASLSIGQPEANAVAPKATGFGADIADTEFDIDEGELPPEPNIPGFSAPTAPDFTIEPPPGFGMAVSSPFPSPDSAAVTADVSSSEVDLDAGTTPGFTTPPGTTPSQSFPKDPAQSDQELSGRFSRVARLPALQALPGMEASVVEPPKKERPQLEIELEREREREQIKKFKKHKKTKRNKSKINSTMTKLMALRSTQVEQSLTVSTKISETFAEGRGKEAPKKVLLRLVASSVIGAVCVILVLANLSVLKSVWLVASRQVSSMIGKKHTAEDEIVTTIPGEEQLEKVSKKPNGKPIANSAPGASGDGSVPAGGPQVGGPQASSFATSRAERHQTHLMPVHKVIDSRNIMPPGAMAPPAPGQKRYQGAVYPYLFTEEEAHRDPKAPRQTDSEIITIPSK